MLRGSSVGLKQDVSHVEIETEKKPIEPAALEHGLKQDVSHVEIETSADHMCQSEPGIVLNKTSHMLRLKRVFPRRKEVP